MQILVRGVTKNPYEVEDAVFFVAEDTCTITMLPTRIQVRDYYGNDFDIGDYDQSTADHYENINDVPNDFDVDKYLYIDGVWSENPAYIPPEAR